MDFAARIKPDLAAIETALKTHLTADLPPKAADLCAHLLFGPGKRIRPLLAVLCARLNQNQTPAQSLVLAAAIEYLHAATLLHDDVLDEAALRRGKPAAHLIWGQKFTILAGDFLLARALSLAAGLDNGAIMRDLSGFAEQIIAGEMREMTFKGCLDLDINEYLRIIDGKTALLFKAACQSGARLGGVKPQQIVSLGEFGRNLGLAFQIEDDIMDYTGESMAQGKLNGNDLSEGKATLPLILALQQANAAQKNSIAAIFAAPNVTREQFCQVRDFIAGHKGFTLARQTAQNYINAAVKALEPIEDNATKTVLIGLATSIVAVNAA